MLPSQNSLIAFHTVDSSRLSMTMFFRPGAPLVTQQATLWLCALWTCFAKLSMFEIDVATHLFHHEIESWNIPNCLFDFFWSNFVVDPFACHITISRAKESHKDNSLSEKAVKEIHEASNCELHMTKSKQLIADVHMTFQRIGEVYTPKSYDGGAMQMLSHN